MNKRFPIILLLFALLFGMATPAYASGSEGEEKEKVNVKEIIFHHLGDGYGWEVPFSHVYRIPLPVIVRAEDGKWFCFSSSKLTMVTVEESLPSGRKSEILSQNVYTIERDGKQYHFMLPHVSDNAGKVVQVWPVDSVEQTRLHAEAKALQAEEMAKGDKHEESHGVRIAGYAYDAATGQYYKEYRPLDFSITKNVLALFIAAIVVTLMVMGLVRYYARKGLKAPRKGMGFMETLVDFIYTGVIKQTLGAKARKFAPYLLTCFFFILVMNLLGLIVIFPGGANLTGNIAITLVLAVMTFVVTNIHGNKEYWKEILWPDVPIWLKCPLPIMQFIEIFGMFTKPAALCVRLFANMMGGHMIVITLTLLIFIFAAFGAAAAGGSVVISVIFSIFMLALDVLVSFIQAYVFTMLSTIFISMAVAEHEHGAHDEHHEATPADTTAAAKG